jgi:hypothetical protein
VPFPALPHWTQTVGALHQAAILAGPLHKALFEPRKDYQHLPQHVRPWGLESPLFPNGGVLHMAFRDAQVRYRDSHARTHAFPLEDHTQSSLLDAILAALGRDGLADALKVGAGEFEKDQFRRSEPLALNREEAAGYAEVQHTVFTGLARFRARLEGAMTPLIVWPHHMDLSMLWFPPSNPSMDEGERHLNFGFAPYTPGQFDLPYLYAYAYPYPEPFQVPLLPEPARWHQEGWRGAVVPYENLAEAEDPAAMVEATAEGIFSALAPLLEE